MESWKAEMTIGAVNSLLRIVYPNGAEPLGQQTIKAGKTNLAEGGKIKASGGDTVSTEAVASRRHAGAHPPVTGWKLELPTTTWHLLLN
jgi:hypothetical protein